MNLCDITTVRSLLSRYGVHTSKPLGQNFLIQDWIPEKIVEASGVNKNCGVLEIGPGIGALTVLLSQHAGQVLALELDRTLLPILKETLIHCDNVKLLFGDATRQDCAALCSERFSELTPVVCANLPYRISTTILTQLLTSHYFQCFTVMVQLEVARRICAVPGTSDYGAFSLLCQYHAHSKLLFEVPPSCFYPTPKVTSAVVRLSRAETPPVQVINEEHMFRIIRAAFGQRRKTLRNALSSAFPELDREQLRNCLLSCGFADSSRGETLSLSQFAMLSNAMEIFF